MFVRTKEISWLLENSKAGIGGREPIHRCIVACTHPSIYRSTHLPIHACMHACMHVDIFCKLWLQNFVLVPVVPALGHSTVLTRLSSSLKFWLVTTQNHKSELKESAPTIACEGNLGHHIIEHTENSIVGESLTRGGTKVEHVPFCSVSMWSMCGCNA